MSRAPESQKSADGRVLGSNNSTRCRVSGSITAVPARVAAVVGVVRTTMLGILGFINLGLTGGCPGGYLVAWSWARPSLGQQDDNRPGGNDRAAPAQRDNRVRPGFRGHRHARFHRRQRRPGLDSVEAASVTVSQGPFDPFKQVGAVSDGPSANYERTSAPDPVHFLLPNGTGYPRRHVCELGIPRNEMEFPTARKSPDLSGYVRLSGRHTMLTPATTFRNLNTRR